MMRRREWTRRRGLMAAFGVVLAADLVAGGVFAGLALGAASAAEVTDSAVTVAWDDGSRDATDPDATSFSGLEVTVSQTRDLTNQGVTVSWAGGTPTTPGEYTGDFLQIMQCWGDADTGPTPQQCQFGAPATNVGTLIGTGVGGRGLVKGEDPAQTYDTAVRIPPPRTNPNLESYAVPFESVRGASAFDITPFWTSASSNEITAARTGADGTGSVVFETQTSLEAPQLGCGAVGADGEPRACWLVVVPRGGHNLDGSPAADSSTGRVSGTPLSASAWKNRIVVPLEFRSVTTACPIGAAEVRTVGSEPVAEAMTSWQAALCESGTVYGFSQIGDAEARTQLVSGISGAAGLGFVNAPLTAEQTGDATLAYAPAVTEGIGIAFNIEYNLTSASPVFAKNGTQVTDLVLTPRLVAKLLTQSYRADVPDGNSAPQVSGNPRSIRQDPEFLELNPEFSAFVASAAPDGLIVSLGSADANALVWDWIRSDPDARAFLKGEPDEWGMRLNSAYTSLALGEATTDSFPKADLSQAAGDATIGDPGYGTLDLRPYVNDMHEAAYRSRRADAGTKIVWDTTKAPPGFTASPPQLPGSRFELAITDTASAARYGLPMARLVNANGDAVAPTAETMAIAVDELAVPTDVPGVTVTDPNVRADDAYPLTLTSYAVVDVCAGDLAQVTAYAGLLDYIAGKGQVQGTVVGQLPPGYVPLSDDQVDQVRAARDVLRAEVDDPQCDSHQEAPEPTPEPTTEPTPDPEPSPTVAPPVPPVDDPEPAPTTPDPEPTQTAAPTPPKVAADDDGGAGRYAFLASLLLGAPCVVTGPLLLRRGL